MAITGFVLLAPVRLRTLHERMGLRTASYVDAALALAGCLLWAIVPGRPEIKIYPSLLVVLGAWALLRFDVERSDNRLLYRLLMIGVIGGLVLQAVVVLYLPTVHTFDEGAYSYFAQTYLRTGMLSGELLGYPPRHFIGFGSWLVLLGHWYQIVGFGWLSGRLFAFIFGLLTLPAVFAAGRRMSGGLAGLIAAVFFALTSTFIESHRIRPDAPMLFMVSLSLFIVMWTWRNPTRWGFFSLGLVSALTLEVHLLGLAFWCTWAAWIGFRWLDHCWSQRRITFPQYMATFLLGSLPPVILFFITHILPDWGLPNAIILSPTGFDLGAALGREAVRWGEYIASFPLEAFITVFALAFAVYRRWPVDRLQLGLVGLLAVAYVFLAPTEWPQYTRYFLPLQALMVGNMLAGIRTPGSQITLTVLALVFGGLIGQAIPALPQLTISGPFQQPVPDIVTFVSENVLPGSTVIINPYYYLFFERSDRYTFIMPGVYPPTISQLGGPDEDDVWPSIAPDVVVLDSSLDGDNSWREQYLETAAYVRLDMFEPEGIEVYVPSDSLLAAGVESAN